MNTVLNIDLAQLFSIVKPKATLTITRPPVNRGTYSMAFNKQAMSDLDMWNVLEKVGNESDQYGKNRIAINKDIDGNVIGFLAATDTVYDTKTLRIGKNGKLASKAIHTLLTDVFKIDWDNLTEFVLEVVKNEDMDGVMLLIRPQVEEEDVNVEGELAEMDETIAQADALNAQQPIVVND